MVDRRNDRDTTALENRGRIRDAYLDLLKQDGSVLVADAGMVHQLDRQLDGILAAAGAAFGASAVVGPTDTLDLSATIGSDREAGGIEPSQSLRAAKLLFRAALPTLAAQLAASGGVDGVVRASIALNDAIMERVGVAASTYVDRMLARIHNSQHDERRRLSRDLHDRIAPVIATASRQVDLCQMYAPIDVTGARQKLTAARQSMNDAYAAVQRLAMESRQEVAERGLVEAIAEVLGRCPAGIWTQLDVLGDPTALPMIAREELFLLAREAIRNAVGHGSPTLVSVTLSSDNAEVRAEIHDNGDGFILRPAEAAGSHLGLISMQERAALLGGRLSIASGPEMGTTITVQIPVPTPPSRRFVASAPKPREPALL